MGRKVKGLPIWAQIVIPIGTAILGLTPWFYTIATKNLERRIQKADSDLKRAQLIMEIIDRADPDYLPLLDSLINTIEDNEIKDAMRYIVETKKELPERTKADGNEVLQPLSIGKEQEDTIEGKERAQFDSTCPIFFLKGDTIAEKDAYATKNFLLNEKKVSRIKSYPFKYHPVIEQDSDWFEANITLAKGITDTNKEVVIYYRFKENSGFAQRPFFYLKEGICSTKYKEDREGNIRFDGYGGNNLLKKCLFTDVLTPTIDTNADIQGWDFVIVIPPYFFTDAVLDSIFYSEFE